MIWLLIGELWNASIDVCRFTHLLVISLEFPQSYFRFRLVHRLGCFFFFQIVHSDLLEELFEFALIGFCWKVSNSYAMSWLTIPSNSTLNILEDSSHLLLNYFTWDFIFCLDAPSCCWNLLRVSSNRNIGIFQYWFNFITVIYYVLFHLIIGITPSMFHFITYITAGFFQSLFHLFIRSFQTSHHLIARCKICNFPLTFSMLVASHSLLQFPLEFFPPVFKVVQWGGAPEHLPKFVPSLLSSHHCWQMDPGLYLWDSLLL